jgi:hypothetical protein
MQPGPPPSPNARRRNKRPIDTTEIDVDKETITEGDDEHALAEVIAPEPDPNWHHKAIALYEGLRSSAVARIYEPSDWQTALMLCEDYSRELKPRKVEIGRDGEDEPIFVEMEVPMPGAKLTAILRGLNSLIATEGDRRRLQIEIKRKSQFQNGAEHKASDGIAKDRFELLNGGRSDAG